MCNGQNGSPNLTGRFLVGLDYQYNDYNKVAKKGGLNKVTLTERQLPRHTHNDLSHSHYVSLNTSYDGNHKHNSTEKFVKSIAEYLPRYYAKGENWGELEQKIETTMNGEHLHSVVGNTGSSNAYLSYTGTSEEFENRPPYYVVAYIIFLG